MSGRRPASVSQAIGDGAGGPGGPGDRAGDAGLLACFLDDILHQREAGRLPPGHHVVEHARIAVAPGGALGDPDMQPVRPPHIAVDMHAHRAEAEGLHGRPVDQEQRRLPHPRADCEQLAAHPAQQAALVPCANDLRQRCATPPGRVESGRETDRFGPDGEDLRPLGKPSCQAAADPADPLRPDLERQETGKVVAIALGDAVEPAHARRVRPRRRPWRKALPRAGPAPARRKAATGGRAEARRNRGRP